MEYRNLGSAGLQISVLSFGAWVTFSLQVGEKQALELMSASYDQGVNFFDNAEVYAAGQAEILMGNVLQKMQKPRDTYCVSSKVFWGGEKPTQNGLSKKHIFDAAHAALKRLQVDYLDLFFCHRPDPQTPIEETVWAMHQLVMQGKVLYWGTSEWSVEQISMAYEIAKANHLVAPSMEQPQYNMFERAKMEQEFLPIFAEYGMGTTIWSPLASGILTGKYNKGIPKGSRADLDDYKWLKESIDSTEGKRKLNVVEKLISIAAKLECTMAQLAIAWCLTNKHVSTVMLGATKLSQLEDNFAALLVYEKLDQGILKEINTLLGPIEK